MRLIQTIRCIIKGEYCHYFSIYRKHLIFGYYQRYTIDKKWRTILFPSRELKQSFNRSFGHGWRYKSKRKRYVPKTMVKLIKRIYNYRCAECNIIESPRTKMHIDHIYPFSKGGTNEPKNLQLLCSKCNQRKSNKINDEN